MPPRARTRRRKSTRRTTNGSKKAHSGAAPRRGTRRPQAEPRRSRLARTPRSFLFWLVLIGITYLVAWAVVYAAYLDGRSPVLVHVTATGFAGTPRLALLGGSPASATWSLTGGGVRTLYVSGAPAAARVRLPVAPSQCLRLAAQLDARCSGGVLRGAQVPLTVERSVYQDVSVDPTRYERLVVTLPAPRPSPDRPDQEFAVRTLGPGRPDVCIDSPSPGTLTLRSGSQPALAKVGGGSSAVACEDGLAVEVGSSPVARTSLLFHELRAGSFEAHARTAVLTGASSGRIEVAKPQDEIPFTSDQTVALRGKSMLRVDGTFDSASPAQVSIPSVSVTSVRLDGDEVVPTNLQRNKALVVSAFLGGIGLLWGIVQLANFLQQRSRREP